MAAKKRGTAKAALKATGMRQGLATYGDAGFSLFLRKAFIKAGGYSDDALDRPIVGITNTYSDFNPCHGNVPDLIEAVKRGVLLSGARTTRGSRWSGIPSAARRPASRRASPPRSAPARCRDTD